jgi:hypothetical protein
VRRPGLRLSGLAAAAGAAWVGRWALLEVAARVANRIPPPPADPLPERLPGRMPGPPERRSRRGTPARGGNAPE